ncbi:ankyrin repeat domain-containing protein [Thiotrichales bacterium 19X7-9]|nr:ankyrin repeat domain-containing protein [Thiotrichales bacterium 19X7-9]
MLSEKYIDIINKYISIYDREKGRLKQLTGFRSDIVDKINSLALSNTANDQDFFDILSAAFNQFSKQGSKKIWDHSFSQSQLFLIGLDIECNNGMFLLRIPGLPQKKDKWLEHFARINLIYKIPEMINVFNSSLNKQDDSYNNTPLHWAIANNSCSSAIILIKHFETDLTISDLYGKNALHTAILKGREHLGDQGDIWSQAFASHSEKTMNDVIISLLEESRNRKFDINAQMSDGNTALHLAYLRKDMSLVKYLIETCGADGNIKNTNGEKPIDLLNKNSNEIRIYLEKSIVAYTYKPTNADMLFLSASILSEPLQDNSYQT